ncbi:MAG TPA: sodium:proton antiporter NhaD [Rectinemataceae bacterium]|nr:sodium:proton antiporter NhaD [Rectinemataceae bacterium]
MSILSIAFIIGYFIIALERRLRVEKAASALILGCILWVILALTGSGGHGLLGELETHLSEIAAIVFFLLGAMTIVEVIGEHDGFAILTSRIRTKNLRGLLWIVSFLTFFLSPFLDNLTTTIVMIAISQKLVTKSENRLFFAGMIVVAANAGGAFSPIGDVTTTMLWIGGQISAQRIIARLFLPSLVSLLVPLAIATFFVKGQALDTGPDAAKDVQASPTERRAVLVIGIALLVGVPFFKIVTGLPPYLGILFALGILWLITDLMHRGKPEHQRAGLGPASAFAEIDLPSLLFFIGILLAVAALQTAGVLAEASAWLSAKVRSQDLMVVILGFLSSVVDNVPLVSAAMGMFSLDKFPMDHRVWELLAYCAGTGGSMLVIGSAAGIAAMGIERISFGWYLKRITPLALLGFLAGVAVYLGFADGF